MLLTELANSGVRLPEIGFGTWNYHGGVQPLRAAIECGARLIDTAESCGTEEIGTDHIDLYQLHWPNLTIPIEEPMRGWRNSWTPAKSGSSESAISPCATW
jgi:diketogulonate reductase-like aldo/keto reductase